MVSVEPGELRAVRGRFEARTGLSAVGAQDECVHPSSLQGWVCYAIAVCVLLAG